MQMSRIGAAAFATLLTAVIVPGVSHAKPPIVVQATAVPTVIVSYADLNLASSDDFGKLNSRIRRAADRLCFDSGTREAREFVQGVSCRNAAVAGANEQVRLAVANAGDTQYAMSKPIKMSLK